MTDKMIVAGSKRLSELAPALEDSSKALLPEFGGESSSRIPTCHSRAETSADARSVNFEIALAVLDQAVDEGVARAKDIPESRHDRREWAEKKRWIPEYAEYQYDPEGLR